MKVFHSRELLATPPRPVQFIVDGILPVTLIPCDISGPPGDGKSTIVLSLAEHVSTGKKWFGHQVQQRVVAWVAAESSDPDAISRDLWRLQADPESDIAVIFPEAEMFRWNKRELVWELTDEGGLIIQFCRDAGIGLLVIDTLGSVCAGLEEINNDQQRQLARMLKKTIRIPTITISHTNQASARDTLSWRLHYLSRAGGNGFPGAIRWAAGVSKLQEQDVESIGYRFDKSEIASSRLVAFGVSKHNEIPRPATCNNDEPMIFEINPSGRLSLAADGVSVSAHKRQAAAYTKACGGRSKKSADVSEVRDDDF